MSLPRASRGHPLGVRAPAGGSGEREPPTGDYCVLVSRVEDRPRAEFWPVGLRQRLPVIPIPLQAPHPDTELGLQPVLHRVYDAAYYRDYIYDGSPWPPLSDADADWACQVAAASAT